MMDDNTHWQPVEPTTPVPYPYPYEYEIGIPPAPPHIVKQRRSLAPLILSVVLAFLLVGAVGLFYLARVYTVNTTQPTPIVRFVPVTPTTTQPVPTTPTPNLNYTATDILHDLNTAGIHPKYVEYHTTIWSWTADTYYVSVDATSSVNFGDDSSCSGNCSPANVGIWVYDSPTTAMEAFNEVLNDEHQPNASIPMMGIPTPTLHGRCLLLSNSNQPIYGQVVTQYCI